MNDTGGDLAAVQAANSAFYRVFESGRLEDMAAVWERSDRVVCTHPGMPTLRGWASIEPSWDAILSSGQVPQFIITEAEVQVVGDVGWVTAVENMLLDGGSAVGSAVNWFVRGDDGWKMIGHHGAPITRPAFD
ncbi:MAG: nuclear transport factor 2 family protein [Acidimicrobiales bacterium]